jgi:D-3-phosphoglycerate dehydrogenase
MKNVVLTEAIDEAGIHLLEGRVNIIVSPDPSEQTVGQLMRHAHALIVRTATRITRPMIEGARELEVISRTGGGLDNIDVQAATDHRIIVCGVKGPQDRSVAEHAVTLMLALAKQLPYYDEELRRGNFKARFDYRSSNLTGKRAGIIGLGRIGRLVAKICICGLGMEVWGYDPYVRAEALKETRLVLRQDMGDVLRTVDFLSLHVPLTQETRGLIGKKELSLMKSTAFIINTSRGEIIQESALVDGLKNNVIAGAGLDVFEKEPPDIQSPLFQLRDVIVTPHSAALTKDTVAELAAGAARNAIDVLDGEKPSYSVNWDEVRAKRKKG